MPLAASHVSEGSERCAGFQDVPGQGPSCPVPGGWAVQLPNGRVLFTHGPDLAPPTVVAASAAFPPWPPACTMDGSAKHIQLIYAHPNDRADGSATWRPLLRDMVNRTNGHLRLEAQIFGDEMSYRFRCDAGGLVNMAVAHLSISNSQASFSSITNDLMEQGYTSSMAKYLVYYDGSLGGGIAGQGNVHYDDRLVASNGNLAGGDFALNYGYAGDFGAFVFSHESGHNLGAVQLSAPNTSGGFHCNDGQDTMCYADGGSNSHYTSGVCTDRDHFDCNHDDYYNPAPEPGNYLYDHWNLGSRLNKYLDFASRPNQRPEMRYLGCNSFASRAGQLQNCSVVPYDPDEAFGNGGGALNVTIDWGDGTQTVVGPVATGSYTQVGHTWAANGRYTMSAWVVDNGTPPLTSSVLTAEHVVACTFRSSNNMVIGLAGVETQFSSRVVTIPCADQPFRLTGNSPNDFDVCWYAEDELLECFANEGNEAGRVPAGATKAHVILRVGALGAYNLYIDAPDA